MNIFGQIKSLIPSKLKSYIKNNIYSLRDFDSRLKNLKSSGFICTGAIDGGANRGNWSLSFWNVFPDIPITMIEPLPDKKEILTAISKKVQNSIFLNIAIGSKKDVLNFIQSDTNSHIVDNIDGHALNDIIKVEVTTLDELFRNINIQKCNLLKLDLQGYELEALKGFNSLNSFIEVLILEVSIIPIGGVPIFREIDNYLAMKDYTLYDIVPQYYRPLDNALWQCDVFYVRNNSLLINSKSWD